MSKHVLDPSMRPPETVLYSQYIAVVVNEHGIKAYFERQGKQ